MKFFAPEHVRLLAGPFADARATDLRYALALDPDRLLAPYLREAGLPPRAPSYGNWEDSGLDGHTAGHYLSALAHLVAGTGEAEAADRLRYVVDELARAQAALGTGYVGGVPGGARLFASLPGGGVPAARALGSGEHWVPWYNLHKVFQGLLDAYRVGGVDRALDVLLALADWWVGLARGMDDAAYEAMLDTEFGGMNDVYAELALLTGRDEYAALARRFAHRAILDPLLDGRDDLTGRHANTQIPKAVGYASTAAATGDRRYLDAADLFWRTVTEHRTVAIGGNSVREHFHDPSDFTPMVDDREGPESCNTVNMLRLTRALAEAELRPEHLDFAERALFNHVLGSQHPDGGFVYFTPMRPRHYRVYSVVDQGFWCCVGTGLEVQARHGEWVFGLENGALAVNLPVAAVLDTPELGGRVRLDTAFPHDDAVRLTLDLDAPRRFPLRLRVPAWSGGLRGLAVDGEPVTDARAVPGAVVLDRTWQPGAVVSYRLPLTVRTEPLPDGSPWQAYLAGPLVLAARDDATDLPGLRADDSRMGHVAHGPLHAFSDVPLVAPGADTLVADGPLRFRLRPLDGAPAVVLEPFAFLHDARYTVYWPVADGDAGTVRAALADLDRGLALDARTLDAVAFGEQQPESDHGFRGPDSTTSAAGGRRWRSTRGRMTVALADPGGAGSTLRVGYRLLDEPTAVDVLLAGEVVATTAFEAGDGFVELDHGVGALLDQAGRPGVVELELRAADGRSTPGVTTVRLLRWAP